MRTAPPETYDAWVNHELPFDSPEIRRAFEILGQIWLNEDYVYGGVDNIAEETLFESPAHLFKNPPGCFLHRQASFAQFCFPPEARYTLYKGIGFRVASRNQFNNNPPPGIDKHDWLLTFNLTYAIGG